ncbi:MAG: pyrophosphatase PpaX [Anaerolineae bacterium]
MVDIDIMMARLKSPPLRAVLFDLDGTLRNSESSDLKAMRRLFRDDLGLEVDEQQLAGYIGVSSREVLERVAPQRVEELLPVWLGYHLELLDETRLFPGILEMLGCLSRAGLGLAVVTGQNRFELDASRQRIAALEDLIGVWVSADDAPFPKPHPAPVQRALEVLGCPPGQAVMVGDTRFDMEAGRRAGTRLGAALWGVRDAAPLLEFDPDFVFEAPQQMKDLLSEM